jgi:hypothetical protein
VTNELGDDIIPFGLIYQASDSLWTVNANGESERILDQFRTSVYDGPTVSPNGAQVLYTEEWDIWLADIATGERDNLTQTLERFECCAQWWPGRSDVILFNSWTKENEGPNYGFPTTAQLDGSGYRVLDESQWSAALPAVSPDGQTVAYDREGQSWLYHWNRGPESFDPGAYGLPVRRAGSPAWSPDEKQLAWVVGGDFEETWKIGLGVFDLEASTSRLLHPYEPMGQGGWPPAPAWSPDGRWLVFTARAQDNEKSGVWVVRADGQQEEEFYVGPCSTPVWSPDGRWLACTSYPQGLGSGVWLIEVGTWVLHSLDLPSDAYLVDWIIPPESWMTYTNNVHRFSLRHPPGFDVPPIDFAESRGYIGDQIVFSVTDQDPHWLGCFFEGLGDCPVMEQVELTRVGNPTRNAIRIQGYIGSIGGRIPQQYVTYLVREGGTYYTFTLYALGLDSQVERADGIWPLDEADITAFERMMETLTFRVGPTG